jgi:hypothetical protein
MGSKVLEEFIAFIFRVKNEGSMFPLKCFWCPSTRLHVQVQKTGLSKTTWVHKPGDHDPESHASENVKPYIVTALLL